MSGNRSDGSRRVRRLVALAATLALARVGPALASEPGAESPSRRAARLPSGDSASEYWELTAQFDSGHRLFSKFMITNSGPGDRTALALTHLVTPEGRSHEFRNGRRKGRWQLSPDGLRIKIGSSVLDLGEPLGRLEIDKTKQQVKIYLRIRWGAGAIRGERTGPDGYHSALLEVAAPIEGSIWVRHMEQPLEVRGRVGVTHHWMTSAEAELVTRRIELYALDAEPALYVSEVTAHGGERFRWLAVQEGGDVVYSSDQAKVELIGFAPGREDHEYPLPRSLCILDLGVKGHISMESVLLENNPLDAIPLPYRWFLSFGARPRRTWASATFDVTFEPVAYNPESALPSVRREGSGVTSVAFLRPLPPPQYERDAHSVGGVACASVY